MAECNKDEVTKLTIDWYNAFKSTPVIVMDDFQMGMFIKLYMLGDEERLNIWEGMLEKDFLCKLCHKRAESINLNLSGHMKMWLIMLSRSPGELVMWLYFLKLHTIEHNGGEITFEDFMLIFPLGYPSAENMSILWDKQKHNGDNLLDLLQVDKVTSI